MKIKRIHGLNFKGQTFTTDLTPVTLLHGPNFAGKSSRPEALTLAMAGYIPSIGAKAGDLHERLASGARMEVGVQFEEASIRRIYSLAKGKVTTEEAIAGLPEDFKSNPVQFDTAEFLGLSPKERTKYLFRTLPPPDLSLVGPEAIVTRIKNIKLDPHTEEAEKAITALCQFIDSDFETNGPTPDGSKSVQEWLDGLVEAVRLKANAANASAKMMKSTGLGVTALKTNATPIALVEQASRAARAKLDAATKAEQEAAMVLTQAMRTLDSAKGLASKADNMDAVKAGITATEATIAELSQKLAEHPEQDTEAAGKAERKAANDWNTAKAFTASCKDQVEKLTTKIKDIEDMNLCEGCTEKLAKSMKKDRTFLKGEITRAEQDEQAKAITYDATMLTLQQVCTANKSRGTLLGDLVAKQRGLAQMQATVAEQAAAQEAKASLPALTLAVETAQHNRDEADAKVTPLREAFVKADTAHRQAIAENASQQQVAKASEAASKADAEAQVTKELGNMLTELLAEAVKASIQPMLDTCNRICGGILRGEMAYQDGEVGMEWQGRFWTWRSFSGTEKALAFAALSVALATNEPVKLVIIDELGRLSKNKKWELINRLTTLAEAGHIDNAILIDTEPTDSQFSETFSQVAI